ncbi:MAG: CDP-alcohol phosphatidyltransferase family protein [Sphingomonas sp.]
MAMLPMSAIKNAAVSSALTMLITISANAAAAQRATTSIIIRRIGSHTGRSHRCNVRNGWKADIRRLGLLGSNERDLRRANRPVHPVANHLIGLSAALYARLMVPHSPDRSRDRRIEDPSNLWIIHPTARALLPWFVAAGISANAVSVGGLCVGALAALADANWHRWPFTFIGLFLSMAWLVADGLDGMIARATGTASATGRFLDGLCDHGVFFLIYVALAASIGTGEAWSLAACAGGFHALQSNLYEGERARFHRRCMGIAAVTTAPAPNRLVRMYDHISGLVDRFALRFDEALLDHADAAQLGPLYAPAAAKPLRLMSLLSANVRVYAVFIACMARDPRLFWWFEIIPMTAILVIGLFWHRAVQSRLIRKMVSAAAS